MNLTFEPLSESRFKEAVSIGARAFPNNKEKIEEMYKFSLDPEKKYLDERRFLQNYIGIDSGADKIIALTGLYNRKEFSEEEVWLGWFCSDPDVRGKGIGRKTLEWTIDKAKELGYKKFRLYTSTDPNEAAAQNLYESVGLKIYKREKSEKFPGEEILYREMDL